MNNCRRASFVFSQFDRLIPGPASAAFDAAIHLPICVLETHTDSLARPIQLPIDEWFFYLEK